MWRAGRAQAASVLHPRAALGSECAQSTLTRGANPPPRQRVPLFSMAASRAFPQCTQGPECLPSSSMNKGGYRYFSPPICMQLHPCTPNLDLGLPVPTLAGDPAGHGDAVWIPQPIRLPSSKCPASPSHSQCCICSLSPCPAKSSNWALEGFLDVCVANPTPQCTAVLGALTAEPSSPGPSQGE